MKRLTVFLGILSVSLYACCGVQTPQHLIDLNVSPETVTVVAGMPSLLTATAQFATIPGNPSDGYCRLEKEGGVIAVMYDEPKAVPTQGGYRKQYVAALEVSAPGSVVITCSARDHTTVQKTVPVTVG